MESRTVWRCFAIGLTCGLRSMAGPAVVRWRMRDPARLALAALAAGEVIADKLPATPPRTAPPALVFRVFSGGFSGRSVAAAFNLDRTAGTIAGVAGAVLAAYAGMALRSQIVKSAHLPDPVVAILEDTVALYGAVAATRP